MTNASVCFSYSRGGKSYLGIYQRNRTFLEKEGIRSTMFQLKCNTTHSSSCTTCFCRNTAVQPTELIKRRRWEFAKQQPYNFNKRGHDAKGNRRNWTSACISTSTGGNNQPQILTILRHTALSLLAKEALKTFLPMVACWNKANRASGFLTSLALLKAFSI